MAYQVPLVASQTQTQCSIDSNQIAAIQQNNYSGANFTQMNVTSSAGNSYAGLSINIVAVKALSVNDVKAVISAPSGIQVSSSSVSLLQIVMRFYKFIFL